MSFRLPEGVRPYLERAPLAALFLGVSSGFTFAMIGATLTTRLAQHGDHQERGHHVRADLSRLQLQVPVGADRRQRSPAAARPLRPAPQLAVADRRAGDGRGRVPRQRRSAAGSLTTGRDRRDHRRRCRRHVRHHHRRLSHRAARAAPARRRLGHVAVRLADRRRRRRVPLALVLAARYRLDRRLYGLRRCSRCRRCWSASVMGEPARHREPARPHGMVEAAGRLFQPACGVPASARARWSCCFSC